MINAIFATIIVLLILLVFAIVIYSLCKMSDLSIQNTDNTNESKQETDHDNLGIMTRDYVPQPKTPRYASKGGLDISPELFSFIRNGILYIKTLKFVSNLQWRVKGDCIIASLTSALPYKDSYQPILKQFVGTTDILEQVYTRKDRKGYTEMGFVCREQVTPVLKVRIRRFKTVDKTSK